MTDLQPKTLVDTLDANKADVMEWLKTFDEYEGPEYVQLVTKIIELDGNWDKDRITEINHGDYQGTLIYAVAEQGYQPSNYIYCSVYYGSCSGCDALQSAYAYGRGPNYEEIYKIMHDIASSFRKMYSGDANV